MVEADLTQNPWMSADQTTATVMAAASVEINGHEMALMELTRFDEERTGFSASNSSQDSKHKLIFFLAQNRPRPTNFPTFKEK
ncbi:hypothetical protein Q3G72_008223 [Acer saccharum]|nr:hypothetical protein Q3G72_008223 [Acer saccharum]